ncbi:hypothetical protein HPB47_020295 [Ixodes persulcatus]|uniref:Uncharacterized protein n=1 Tax=Ixodes persulcatus TaxID=34615 RepID=A0AC60QFR5_IXOPE|nr:hypothetical protein HPB47_020295 [Ixodes persulcatus]
MLPAPEEDNSEFFIDEEEASKIEDGTEHPTTTHTQTPSAADKRGASQDEDTTASILEADKKAACVRNGTDIDRAARGSSKSQRQKTVDGNDRSLDDASEVDSEMDDSSDLFKRPLDRVEEEDPDLEGPNWSKPQGRKKCKPRAPSDGQQSKPRSRLPYQMLVGGVFAIKREHFLKVNGFSNLYWGWGGEDDDMAYRINHKHMKIIRPPASVARYTMIKHIHRPNHRTISGRASGSLWTRGDVCAHALRTPPRFAAPDLADRDRTNRTQSPKGSCAARNGTELVEPAASGPGCKIDRHSYNLFRSYPRCRMALVRMAWYRMNRDGLSTAKYRVVAKQELPLYTHVLVDIGHNHKWHFSGSHKLIINL